MHGCVRAFSNTELKTGITNNAAIEKVQHKASELSHQALGSRVAEDSTGRTWQDENMTAARCQAAKWHS